MANDQDVLVAVKFDTTTDEYPDGEPGVETDRVIPVPESIYQMDHESDFDTDYVSDYLSNEYGWCVEYWMEY